MSRWIAFAGALALAATLAACAKPIPPEHRDMVGLWESAEMRLLITADGRADYERKKGTGNVSIDAPIQQIRADGFTVGVGPMTTDFRIDKRPHKENGAWTMTVDGVVLWRRDFGPPAQ